MGLFGSIFDRLAHEIWEPLPMVEVGDASVPSVHHPAVLRVPMRMLSAPLTKIVVERRLATERGLNRES